MIFRFLILLVCLLLPGLLHAQSQDYLWPTNASQHLTSTFGETRSAHFHSGLDIKTWGREGYEVYASKDGTVYRMGVTVRGYGKVIYLKHEDGSYTVYAHLQRLNDRFQAIVDSVRMLDYSFETDIYPAELNLKVKKGEVIGYTGSTGIGPPHLHFETRHEDEKPFNALRTNIRVKDTIAPTLPSIQVVPLSPETRIRGSYFPQVYYPAQKADNTLNFGIIEASGPIGISVSANDGANEVTNQYAVYELGLLSEEGDTLFYERLDEFYFREDDLMFQDRIPPHGSARRYYQTLFKKDGPEVPFYEIVEPGSVIRPSDTLQQYTLFASDYFGNKTVAEFQVKLSDQPVFTDSESIESPLREWYWTEDWVSSDNEVIGLRTPDFGTPWDPDRQEYLLNDTESEFLVARLNPENSYSVWSPDRNIRLRFGSDTFFDTLSIAMSQGIYEGHPYLQILPTTANVRKEIEIQFHLSEENFIKNNGYGLYRLNRDRDRITPVDYTLKGRTIFGYPSSFGEFLILADNEAPVLTHPRIFRTDYGKWFFTVTSRDELSGIDFRNSEIVVNGVRGITEFDYEEELLIYHHPGFRPGTSNKVEVTVADKAGNLTLRTFTL